MKLDQFPGNRLIKNLLNGQRHDDRVFPAKETIDLSECIASEIKPNKKALLPLGSKHSCFELVDIGTTDFILLFDLNWIPVIHEVQLTSFLATLLGCSPNRIYTS